MFEGGWQINEIKKVLEVEKVMGEENVVEAKKAMDGEQKSQNVESKGFKKPDNLGGSGKGIKILVAPGEVHLNRLTKLYPKPAVGEEIPVTVLEVVHRQVGWSPEDCKTVYIDEGMDSPTLKRVRGVNEVKIFNWLSGTEGLIELGDEEAESFQPLLKKEARLIYTRVNVKGKLKPHFTTDESKGPKPGLLSEKL